MRLYAARFSGQVSGMACLEGSWPSPWCTTACSCCKGRLLVSREWAVFCRVPPDEVDALKSVLAGEADLGSLSAQLSGELE